MSRPRLSPGRALWAASFRHLLKHPGQLALALTGLALGVATITAVDIATASSRRAFMLSVSAVTGPATHEITGGPNGIDERWFGELVRANPQLAFAPLVSGYVSVGDEALELIGIDPLSESAFGEAGSAPGGGARGELTRWLTERGTVLMTADTAARLGLKSRAAFAIDVAGRAYPAVLLGRIEEDQAARATLLFTDIAQAQEWLGTLGRLSAIEIRAPDGAAGGAALDALRAQLPAGAALAPVQRRSATSLAMVDAFTTNLHAMSLLALLVGLFLIYGAVSFAVLQRRKTLGVLRALGTTRAEVLKLVLAEAAVLGVVGSVLGVLLGAALGRSLLELVTRTINDLYFVLNVTRVELPARIVALALAAGVLTALAAALVPALEAAHTAPQLGLRRSVLEQRAVRISRLLVLVSALLGAGALTIVLASTRSLLAGFAALFLLLLGVAALTPALLRGAALAAARLLGRTSALARLAFSDVAASLSRTGVAVAALGMALAAMIGVAVMVESFRISLNDWLLRTMRADVYVTAPGPGFARPERRLDPHVIAALLKVPGIRDHSTGRRVTVDSSRGPITLDAVGFAPESYAGIQIVSGAPQAAWSAFARGAILLAEPLAWRFNLGPGGELALATPAGLRAFPIAGVYREYGNDRGGVLMRAQDYGRVWGDAAVSALGLYLAPGVTPSRIIQQLYAAAGERQALLIGSNAEIRELSMSIFERTFVVTRVLYWLAAIVAAIGLASALLAWQLEHLRELAVLRTLGLTPRAGAVLIEVQTLFMGLVALAAAIPAGLVTALLLVEVINRRAFGWQIDFHMRGRELADALVLAVAAALAAGIYPAWRSARTQLAAEVREE